MGETRARLNVLEFEDPYLRANVTEVPDEVQTDGEEENPLSVEAMRSGLQDIFKEYLLKNPKLSKELAFQVEQTEELQKLVDVIAANVPFGYKDAQLLLEEQNLMDRYELLVYKLVSMIQVLNVKEELQAKVKERVDKNQREYILREEMKLIREELGDDSTLSDADEFQQAAEKLQASDEVKEKLYKEIKRFRNSMGSPAETGVIRTYIETMLEMPWDKMCEEHSGYCLCKRSIGSRALRIGKSKGKNSRISGSSCLDKTGRRTDSVSSGTAGNWKNIHCKISCACVKEALCPHFFRRSAGRSRNSRTQKDLCRSNAGTTCRRFASGRGEESADAFR